MTHLDDEILAEIVLVIDRVSWTELQDIETIHRGAVAYRGDDKTDDGPRWRLFVAGWSTGTPTRWRFDGTATRGELIVRLTPELAERAARKANPTRST